MLLRLLIIGISFLFFSCERTDENGSTKTFFSYKNETNQNVEIVIKEKVTGNISTYLLEPNQTKSFESNCIGSGDKGLCEEFLGENEILFKFITDNKCLENYPKIYNGVLYDNFNVGMLNLSINNLIYKIDNEEIAAATTCN